MAVRGSVTASGLRQVGPILLGQLTIAAGSSSTVLTLEAPGDTAVRARDDFFVTLEAPTVTSVRLGSPIAIDVALVDDDELTVSLVRTPGDTAFAEGGSGAAGRASFTVRLRGGTPTAPVRVPFFLARTGTASRADVETPTTSTSGARVDGSALILPAGSTSGLILYTARDDNRNEGSEELVVSLGRDPTTAGRVRAGSPASASAELTDNDTTFVIVRPAAATVTEGESASLRFAFSGARLDREVEVTYKISGSGITAADFATLPGRPDPGRRDPLQRIVAVPGAAVGNGSFALQIPTAQDFADDEGRETAALAIVGARTAIPGAGALGLGTPATAQLTLQPHGGLFVGFPSDPEVEEGGSLRFVLAASRPGIGSTLRMGRQDSITGRYQIVLGEGRGAASAGDFAPRTSFAKTAFTIRGQTTTTLTVNTINDSAAEATPETFTIVLSDLRTSLAEPIAPHPTRGSATGRIRDDEIAFAIEGPPRGGQRRRAGRLYRLPGGVAAEGEYRLRGERRGCGGFRPPPGCRGPPQ